MTAVIGDLIPSADSFQVDAGFKMGAAQAAIRRYCGWHVAPSVTRTIRLDGHGGDSLLLPSKHVTALSSLKLDGVEHVQDARFGEAGSLVLVNGVTFPDLPGECGSDHYRWLGFGGCAGSADDPVGHRVSCDAGARHGILTIHEWLKRHLPVGFRWWRA